MRIGMIVRLFLLLVLLQAGCSRPATAPAPTLPPQPAINGKPQPKLPTIKLWLGAKEIVAEQAITPEQIQTGMMFRQQMAENEGMLFVFGRPHQVSFWMRNTFVPLSCAYVNPDGLILEIHDMKPLDESSIQAASDQVQFVLEMNQGWFQRNHVGVGALVRTERGSLAQTYFGRP